MNENVFATILLDESETLRLVEPLHGSNSHSLLLANWGVPAPTRRSSRTGSPDLVGRVSGRKILLDTKTPQATPAAIRRISARVLTVRLLRDRVSTLGTYG